MAYQTVYRMIFTNDHEGIDTIIHISDTTSGTGTPVFTDLKDTDGEWLTMSANLRTANDGEDKLAFLRSLRFNFSYQTTPTFHGEFFLEGEDNRWLVQVYLQNTSGAPIFTGYLVPDGAKDVFLDERLYGVELTASDNLATLSDVPWRKPDTSVPKGMVTIIEAISWCLLNVFAFPIKVVYSLREENLTGADDAFFRKIYYEAMAHETDIGDREDCLTVLSKLLTSLGCFITQYNSEWWIIRVDEQTGDDYTIYEFDSAGVYIGVSTGSYVKTIGSAETINLVNEDAAIFPERQIKFAKQTFRYDYWQEMLCNINYTRGSFNGVISVPAGYSAYNFECWTNQRNYHGTPALPQANGYIRRKYTNGYEEERVIVLPPTANGGHFFKSEQIKVNKLDKFTFSVDRRLDTDHTGSGTSTDVIAMIRLYGDDGSFWVLIGADIGDERKGAWKLSTGSWSVFRTLEWQYQRNAENETNWSNHTITSDPLPVAGKVEILLLQSENYFNVNYTQFANLQFEYIPIIDGVYQKVTGQYHKVYTNQNRKASKDDEIYFSDAQSPQWKGVLHRDNAGNKVPIGNVYDYRYGTTGALGLDRMGKYQAFGLWNQYNRTIRKFQGSLLGLDTDVPDLPSMVHVYQFTDPANATTGKYYQLLGFDIDLATCQWSGTFADVHDSLTGKDYSSAWEFKYTTK